ncbi:hypothetical protein PoB_006968500 [Plakobranchus ocellatus]|uniref:Uncharacterized protein n=1 Tax=Plakobranchus ocellatus TaxID=259542 RepID=A0AAV4DGD2_9GAST|nr:hypothetical protein PoB_006968500 [Plakobranchus ocellatus]
MQVNPSLDNGMEQILTPVWDHGCVLFRQDKAGLILFEDGRSALAAITCFNVISYIFTDRWPPHSRSYLLLRLIKTKVTSKSIGIYTVTKAYMAA